MLRFIFYVNIFKAVILSAVSQHGSGGDRGGFALGGVTWAWAMLKMKWGGCGPPRAMAALLLAPMEAGDGCRPLPTTLHRSSAPGQLFVPFTPLRIEAAATTLHWARSILQFH